MISEYKFIRIILGALQDEISLMHKGNIIKLSKITSFWYRRGSFKFNLSNKILSSNEVDYLNWYNREIYFLKETIYDILKRKKHIGDLRNNRLNKIEVLLKARECGINIPKILITNKKQKLKDFIDKHKFKVITKSIKDNLYSKLNDSTYVMQYTAEVESNLFNSLPKTFGYSLFQEYIEKKFELRIFFLNKEFYAMAIFSQNNPKTKIDFRRYDTENPNRTMPYLLPKKIENKLTKLMNLLNLNSGSIDMIVSKNNKYVFLEVNPVGQFGQVSLPCNYNIEKKIAKYLL